MFQDSELQLDKLGNFLRLARKRRGWRQETFAEVVNPYKDEVGISMESERAPKRISANRYDRNF